MKRFLNLFFTETFKVVLFFLLVLFSFLTSSNVFKSADIYKNDSAAFLNVIVQRNDFDFLTSKLLEREINDAIENVVSYSLDYHRKDSDTNHSSTYDLNYSVDTVIYLANTFVKDNIVNKTFVDIGFIELIPSRHAYNCVEIDGKYYQQKVNEENIRSYSKVQNDLIMEYARRSTDKDYRTLAETLENYKDFSFAVVNHTTGKIVSNIEEINGCDSSLNIRTFFGSNSPSLLIVRDAQNPLYESGTMSQYVYFVQETADGYSDRFDLYISFPESFEFADTKENYAARHKNAEAEFYSYINKAVIYLFVTVFMFSCLIIVSGKKEFSGKVYFTSFDKLPNDVLIPLYLIVIVSLLALLENSTYMIIKTTEYENYWFNRTPDFYIIRANVTATGVIVTLSAFACTLKRQCKNKTLVSNTYISRMIKAYKPIFSKRKDRD